MRKYRFQGEGFKLFKMSEHHTLPNFLETLRKAPVKCIKLFIYEF